MDEPQRLHVDCAIGELTSDLSFKSIGFVIRHYEQVDIHSCAKNGEEDTEEWDVLLMETRKFSENGRQKQKEVNTKQRHKRVEEK